MLYEEEIRNQQQAENNMFDNAGGQPSREAKDKKKGRKGGRGKKALAVVLGAALFGTVAAGTFWGVNYAAGKMLGQDAAATAQATVTQDPAEPSADQQTGHTVLRTTSVTDDGVQNSQSLDVSDVAAGVMPSMVSITNTSVQEVRDYLSMFGMGGRTYEREVQSSGSGIIIGENEDELLIVTNNHVVEGAETLSVCFVDNSVMNANIKGTDADNDLAVIAVKMEEIPEETKETIRVAQIGDSETLVVGQQVVAIGNALGYGQSVTTGIISALNRQIDTTDAALIQTDAAINPGNSGGALLNMKGEVIGINSAKFASTEVEGMGYAISISTAAPIMEDLMNRQSREKAPEEQAAWLGITGRSVPADVEEAYGIPMGVYVVEIEDNTSAQKAGLQEGSVITAFDGQKVETIEDLKELLTYYKAGETVKMTVMEQGNRGYEEKTITVTLGSYTSHEALQSWEDEIGKSAPDEESENKQPLQ